MCYQSGEPCRFPPRPPPRTRNGTTADERDHPDHDAEMGSDDDRGKSPRLAEEGGRQLSRRRGIARNRDDKDHQRLRGERTRHVAPHRRRFGRDLADRRAARGRRRRPACPTARSTPLSPGSSRPNRPPKPTAGEADEAAPREIDAGGRRLRVLDIGDGEGRADRAGARVRRRPQRLDVQSAGAGRRTIGQWAARRRDRPAGAWRLGQTGRCRRCRDLSRRRLRCAGRARRSSGFISSVIRWAARSRCCWPGRCRGASPR